MIHLFEEAIFGFWVQISIDECPKIFRTDSARASDENRRDGAALHQLVGEGPADVEYSGNLDRGQETFRQVLGLD